MEKPRIAPRPPSIPWPKLALKIAKSLNATILLAALVTPLACDDDTQATPDKPDAADTVGEKFYGWFDNIARSENNILFMGIDPMKEPRVFQLELVRNDQVITTIDVEIPPNVNSLSVDIPEIAEYGDIIKVIIEGVVVHQITHESLEIPDLW